MKNYFDFELVGKRFLPVWLVFLVLVVLPYGYSVKRFVDVFVDGGFKTMDLRFQLIVFAINVVSLLICFFIIKLTIQGIRYSGREVRFEGRYGTYLGKGLLGTFLSIITAGLYSGWFIKNMAKFFVNKSSLDENKFEFLGNGGVLTFIILFAFVFPVGLVQGFYMLVYVSSTDPGLTLTDSLIFLVVFVIVLIPYLYLLYQWMVDFRYKMYHISWKTKFGPAFAMILGQVLLMMVTLGIYAPLGYLRLYRYFAERTVAERVGKSLRFGYELDAKKDFLFIWGQSLLTLVTLGIYYPWAFSKIGKRVLSKTYSTDSAEY